MNDVKIYEIGGKIRDEILGVKNKDVDFCVEAKSYQHMKDYILSVGGTIFLESPEFVTIRSRIGRDTADYVLCRKESSYTDGRHPDKIEAGTLFEDQKRRDFKMNSIAKDVDGNYIDPFNGIKDIENRLISCVGNTYDRITEDYLRLLRAARFSITKQFRIHGEIEDMFYDNSILTEFQKSISRDRVREELYKMFHYDTKQSIWFFGQHILFSDVCFGDDIWMKPTFEIK